ncbi:cupredoxin domain-containing protein [Neobacillus muris]|uniref:cupredoxin domain-containing protein n=1 Tax=Neobacillus muris TaxID=2941334 RepID=UPI00203B0382|nr:cupredoxin domain-containing protein [Neobacillus muris]
MNIFYIASSIIVAAISTFSIYLLYHHKTKLAKQHGLIAAIGVSAATGLLSGCIIGLVSGEIFLVTGTSMIIGFMIGFLAGHSSGLPAIVLSSLSGLMGGIIGAILGALLQFINPAVLLGILLGFYIVIMGMVVLFLLAETNDKILVQTDELSPFAIIAAGILLISLFLFLYSSDIVEIPSASGTAQAQAQQELAIQPEENSEIDASDETEPKINILVTEKGYTPNIIRVKKGSLVELQIETQLEDSCYTTFNLPDFNIQNTNLKAGTTNISFIADKSGEFTYSCGMNMLKGTIIVE